MKRKKPKIDHSLPFSKQIQQLQDQINRKSKANIKISKVNLSKEEIYKITAAWCREPDDTFRKQKLTWLLLFIVNPNVSDLARKVGLEEKLLLTALKELRTI